MNLHRLKLKYKLLLIVVAVASTITIFLAAAFTFAIHQYNELLYRQTANSLSFVSDEITYRLKDISSTSAYIALDQSFQNNLAIICSDKPSSLATQKAQTAITGIFTHYYTSTITSITILAENNFSLWWGAKKLNETDTYMKALLERCDEENGRPVWAPSGSGSGVLCARKIRESKNLSLMPLGYLIIQVDLNGIVDSLLNSRYTKDHDLQIYINSGDSLIYPSSSGTDADTARKLASFASPYAIGKIGKSRMFVTSTAIDLDSAGWSLSLAVAYGDIFRSLKMIFPAFALSLVLALLIAGLLAGNIARKITEQFNTLVGKMNAVKQEGIMDMKLLPQEKLSDPLKGSHDEMTVLNSYFDQMILELKKLIEESYVQQLLITQAELKALEQQLNPHFLYNTLNTVNWLAKKAGETDISIIAESLGTMLQNTLKTGKTVTTIEEELEIISSYLKIQKIRFEDLTVTEEIDRSLIDAEIPRMSIQPLIENAIYHSQEEPQMEYRIFLTIQREEESIRIEVANSGSRMDPDILTRLREHTAPSKGNGIGLLNIDSRLRILYGDASGLTFENRGDMAVVRFLIPFSQTAY